MGIKMMIISVLAKLPGRIVPDRVKNWTYKLMYKVLEEEEESMRQTHLMMVRLNNELKEEVEKQPLPVWKRQELRKNLAEIGEELDEIWEKKLQKN